MASTKSTTAAAPTAVMDIESVLRAVKTGKATKSTLAAFESLNGLLKASDPGAAAQIKPRANELVDTYVSLISRHAETKKMYVSIHPRIRT
jgi:hypothetical protein